MNGFLFDTSSLLDIATSDPSWLAWSESQLCAAAAIGPVFINPIIYAELAPAFGSERELEKWSTLQYFGERRYPYTASWLAAQAFLKYRKIGGLKTSPLPDFYIGAHAVAGDLVLVTRDKGRFSTYFPTLTVIAP